MMMVLLAILGGALAVGSAVAARHGAQAAADLSALAGAQQAVAGRGPACEHAASVARRMRASVTRCVVEDLDVVVSVDIPVRLGRLGFGTAHASARAGPT